MTWGWSPGGLAFGQPASARCPHPQALHAHGDGSCRYTLGKPLSCAGKKSGCHNPVYSGLVQGEKEGAAFPRGLPCTGRVPGAFPIINLSSHPHRGPVNNSPSYRIPYPKAFWCCHVSLVQVMYISCKSRHPITYFSLANAGNIPGTDEGLRRCQILPTDIFWRRINLTLDPMHDELSAGGWKSSMPHCLLHCEVVENR